MLYFHKLMQIYLIYECAGFEPVIVCCYQITMSKKSLPFENKKEINLLRSEHGTNILL